jgi:hypothetical protein
MMHGQINRVYWIIDEWRGAAPGTMIIVAMEKARK